MIYASGTLGRKFNRKQTGRTSWDEARVMASRWEMADHWNNPEPEHEKSPVPRMAIKEAIEAFLASRQNRGIESSSLNKYRTFTKQLQAYADMRGYLLLKQLSVADMDRFYASWRDGKRSRAKKLERLKAFVKFCLKRKWLDEDISEDLQAPEGVINPCQQDAIQRCGNGEDLSGV